MLLNSCAGSLKTTGDNHSVTALHQIASFGLGRAAPKQRESSELRSGRMIDDDDPAVAQCSD